MVAVTLIYHEGYFRQVLDKAGNQTEQPDTWDPSKFLADTGIIAKLPLANRTIAIRIWRYDIAGSGDHSIPAYLLDTDLPENSAVDRTLTNQLYGGDLRYRLEQEALLGLGGLAALAALGYREVEVFHMNEGHSSLLTVGLLESRLNGRDKPDADDIEAVRRRCVFTTHTPVPAGHDKFDLALAGEVLGAERLKLIEASQALHEGMLNMTYLALRFSHYVNGVAMIHGDISRHMFPEYSVRAITNGVHATTWTSQPFQQLFDKHMPEWRNDNLYLRYAIGIPAQEIAAAHRTAKRATIAEIKRRSGVEFDEEVLTIGFARRATHYKRADLLFADLDRLRSIVKNAGKLQVVFGGKAHPADLDGKKGIREVFAAAAALADEVQIVFLENYDMTLATYLVSGVDIWLNTPLRPQEASGTSGMKAALNGVPSFSILDGWWIEGCVEGHTGWAIGNRDLPLNDERDEINSLYDKLEHTILPLFYRSPDRFAEVRRCAIALNGSFFNTDRMLEQYMANAYPPPRLATAASASAGELGASVISPPE